VVSSIQTFGQKINLHPHIHCLVTEGGEDCEGTFHHLAEFQDSLLAELFKREVFTLLLGEELISEALVEKIMGWSHSGFSVHSKVRAKTKKEAERVGKSMIRPLFSLERLSFSEKEGEVNYRYRKDAEEVERMDYLEFIFRNLVGVAEDRSVPMMSQLPFDTGSQLSEKRILDIGDDQPDGHGLFQPQAPGQHVRPII
jgi:hypothetical protein